MDIALLITAAVFIIAIIVLNIIATVYVAKSGLTEADKKKAQLIVIWLLPFIGSIASIVIHREEVIEKRKKQIGNQTSISEDQAIDHYLASDIKPGDVSGND